MINCSIQLFLLQSENTAVTRVGMLYQSKRSFIRIWSSTTLLADVVGAGVSEQEAESGRPCTVN